MVIFINFLKPEGDVGNDKLPIELMLKNTLTIGKLAFRIAKFLDALGFKVKTLDFLNHLAHLLTISTNIRHRTGPHISRDRDEVLDASELMGLCKGNQMFSFFPCSNLHSHLIVFLFDDFDPRNRNFDH